MRTKTTWTDEELAHSIALLSEAEKALDALGDRYQIARRLESLDSAREFASRIRKTWRVRNAANGVPVMRAKDHGTKGG